MATHNDFGRASESLATAWLEEKGFFIVARNWRSGRYEIDIIAVKDSVLHVVEVKARRDDRFGLPEDWVDRRKGRFLTRAGTAFQSSNQATHTPPWNSVQYDIIAVLSLPGRVPEIFYIEDVYWWG